MKKAKILDIVFVSLIFLFLVTFPFDLWIKDRFYLYLAQALARIMFIVFLALYDHFKKMMGLSFLHFKKTDLLFIPLLLVVFCNFYYLSERGNGFSMIPDNIFVIQIFFQISVAISEELLFRSLIQNNLSFKKPLANIAISSAIFALFHLTYFFSSFNPATLIIPIYTFGLGFILGFIYEYSEQNFLYISGYHFLFNLINQVLYVYMLKTDENYLFYVNAMCVGIFGALYLLFLVLLFRKTNKSLQR